MSLWIWCHPMCFPSQRVDHISHRRLHRVGTATHFQPKEFRPHIVNVSSVVKSDDCYDQPHTHFHFHLQSSHKHHSLGVCLHPLFLQNTLRHFPRSLSEPLR